MRPGLTLCGMTFAGDCADFAPPANKYACESRTADGYYVNCSPTASFGDVRGNGHHWGSGPHWHGFSWGHDDDDDNGHGNGHHSHGNGHGNGHGGNCHGHGHGHGHDDDDDEIDEVITTYVQPT